MYGTQIFLEKNWDDYVYMCYKTCILKIEIRKLLLFSEPLDQLSETVVSLFSGVENKSVIAPEWTTHPVGPEQSKVCVGCVVIFWCRKQVCYSSQMDYTPGGP